MLASVKSIPEERTVMTVFWIIGVSALVVIWAITVVDVFRRHYSGGATVGWLALSCGGAPQPAPSTALACRR